MGTHHDVPQRLVNIEQRHTSRISSAMAQFNISPCTAEDLPAIAAISLDAFTSNPRTMSYWMLRDAKREELLPWRLSRVAHDFHNDANARYYKLVDMESGNIVAHIVWETPTQEVSSEEEEENRRIEQEFKTNEVVPAGVNKAMQEQFRADTKSMRAKYVDKTKDYGKCFHALQLMNSN